MSEKVLQALRASAWQRAKAELSSLGEMDFAPESNSSAYSAWDKKCFERRSLINNFIDDMESHEFYL